MIFQPVMGFRSTRGSLPSPPLQNRTCHFHGIRLRESPDPLAWTAPHIRTLERPPFTAPTRVSSHPLGEPPASSGFCTVTCYPLLQKTVPTSAYPRHYPRPLLFGESHPCRHLVGTYSR